MEGYLKMCILIPERISMFRWEYSFLYKAKSHREMGSESLDLNRI
jgi:hypothetical protein